MTFYFYGDNKISNIFEQFYHQTKIPIVKSPMVNPSAIKNPSSEWIKGSSCYSYYSCKMKKNYNYLLLCKFQIHNSQRYYLCTQNNSFNILITKKLGWKNYCAIFLSSTYNWSEIATTWCSKSTLLRIL